MKQILVLTLMLLALSGAGCDLQRLKIDAPITTSTPQTAVTLPDLPAGQLTIFVSHGCPHCAIVESHVKNGGIDKKLPVVFMEVNGYKDKLALLLNLSQKCGLSAANLSVPMLWDGSHCLIGDKQILQYIDNEADKIK